MVEDMQFVLGTGSIAKAFDVGYLQEAKNMLCTFWSFVAQSNPLTRILFKAQSRTTIAASEDIYWNSLPPVAKQVRCSH